MVIEEQKRRLRHANDMPPTKAPCFVNIILHDLAYGGPEEGGWWYDTYQRVECHYCANATVMDKVLLRISRRFANDHHHPISSVLSDGEYIIMFTLVPEPYFIPERKPRYE